MRDTVSRRIWEPLAVFAITLSLYVAITPRTNPAYRHFVYMADAFLQGRVDLQGLPDYYHDVISFNGRIYAPFPPVPAVILMPAVAVGGEGTDQGRIGQVLTALAVAIFVAGLRRWSIPGPVRLFCGAALAFGSVLWPAAAIGTSWFFAQEVVVLATAVLVWELGGEARPVALGATLAAAWLTRLSMLPAVPVLAVWVWARHRRIQAVAAYLAVSAAGLAAYMLYNLLRFGDPLQTGYRLLTLAAVNAEAVAAGGFFNARYIPDHLYAMLFRAPELIPHLPFLRPSPWGMALLFTSPVILRLAFPARRPPWLPWGALILSIALPMLTFFSVGWVQFGYRYSLDWWAFLLVLLAFALGERPRGVDYGLLALSVAMNAVGVYWVRALGW
ncbi:MAG: hypothetical protein HY334_03480 [Armatimonadetes bacterium]|nr:hypothetical protein [Armatimonadota bacterium]